MLAHRASKENTWFLKTFSRALKRQEFKQADSIDFATAENWLVRPDLLKLIKTTCCTNLEPKHLSYAGGLGGPPELLKAIAGFYNSFFSPKIPVKVEHLVVGAGCSGIIDTLIHDICDPGEGLLVSAPMWGSFEISAIMRNGVNIIPVYISPQASPKDIVAAYRQAAQNATCKARGVLFCNPHNPSGHIHAKGSIESILQYCEEADLHFIADEIYALSTFGRLASGVGKRNDIIRSPASHFESVLQMDLKELGVDASRVHQIYSVSKDFGSSGLRLGCLVTQGNKKLRMSQAILNNAKMSNSVSIIFTPLLNDIPTMRTLVEINQRRLREAAEIAVRFAEIHGLSYYSPVSGLFIWVRLSPNCVTWNEEERIVQRCASHGVLIGSGADYAEENPGWFRLVYSVTKSELITGLQRIEEALQYPLESPRAELNPSMDSLRKPSWLHWLAVPNSWLRNKSGWHFSKSL